jgi:hypothetical protein
MANALARFAFGRGSDELNQDTQRLYGEYDPDVIRNMLTYLPPVLGTNIAWNGKSVCSISGKKRLQILRRVPVHSLSMQTVVGRQYGNLFLAFWRHGMRGLESI